MLYQTELIAVRRRSWYDRRQFASAEGCGFSPRQPFVCIVIESAQHHDHDERKASAILLISQSDSERDILTTLEKTS